MNYIYAIVASLSLMLTSIIGYRIAASEYQHKIDIAEQVHAQATIAAQTHAAQVEQVQQRKSQEIANAYGQDMDVIRRYYASRVRRQPAVRASVPAAAQGAPVAAASAPDAGLAERCTETTLMLVDLQKWVKSEGLQ